MYPVGVLEVEHSTLWVRRQKSFCRWNFYVSGTLCGTLPITTSLTCQRDA